MTDRVKTPREALVDVLAVLDEQGGWLSQKHQNVLRGARQALVEDAERSVVTVVCNIPLCPSRLELPPCTTRMEADEIANHLRWKVMGVRHHCPGCAES